jgi:hypothetical protein
MPARRVMGCRVTAGRVVAAADVAACLTHAQVNPLRAAGQALLAAGNRLGKLEMFNRVEVGAAGHEAMVAATDLIARKPVERRASRTCELRGDGPGHQLDLARLVSQRPQVDAVAARLGVTGEQFGAVPCRTDADL